MLPAQEPTEQASLPPRPQIAGWRVASEVTLTMAAGTGVGTAMRQSGREGVRPLLRALNLLDPSSGGGRGDWLWTCL